MHGGGDRLETHIYSVISYSSITNYKENCGSKKLKNEERDDNVIKVKTLELNLCNLETNMPMFVFIFLSLGSLICKKMVVAH